MTPHDCGPLCPCSEPAIEAAEFDRDHGLEADSFGWMANREADRYENYLDRIGGAA